MAGIVPLNAILTSKSHHLHIHHIVEHTQDAHKTVMLDVLPPVLQFQLKRFEFDKQENRAIKVGVSGKVVCCTCQLLTGASGGWEQVCFSAASAASSPSSPLLP